MLSEKLLTWLQNNSRNFLKSNRWQIIIILLGLSLIGTGILTSKTHYFKDSEVEIIKTSENISGEIVVEISGSVEKPGVYNLPNGSRIDDLLIAAGGFSATAHRELIDKTVNRAAKLLDGQKLYIPSTDEQTQVLSANSLSNELTISNNISPTLTKIVNINTASTTQLESLPGIGPVLAQKIIEERPYSNIAELVSRKILGQKTFDKIKELLTAY